MNTAQLAAILDLLRRILETQEHTNTLLAAIADRVSKD